ncbi:MAG: hypothetical protein GSR85_10250 [Desulfurococcales archaeon]|nr:hypothetical protein [Desulfurococcales archaeon]
MLRAKHYSILMFVIALLIGMSSSISVSAEEAVKIAIDLSHGQAPEGIDIIVSSCQDCYWILILQTEDQKEAIEPGYLELFNEVRVGGLTQDTLNDVDILLIGQATATLSEEELSALESWFSTGSKAVWVGADSDYPAQGSEIAQFTLNQVMEATGSVIRIDYVSIEDDRENVAGAPYRVKGVVDPDPAIADIILKGLKYKRVLFHGPGGLYVLVDDKPINPVKQPDLKPDNVYVVVRTTEESRSVEHQANPLEGQHPAEFYDPLNDTVNTGPFPLMIAEYMDNNRMVLASGETMYGGYEPMVVPSYKDEPLDGPQFTANILGLLRSVVTGTFKPGTPMPPTVTVTEVTLTMTVAETTTVTKTVERTTTITSTVVQTTTSVSTTVITTTQKETQTVTETATVTNWGVAVGLFVVGIILGAGAILLSRR